MLQTRFGILAVVFCLLLVACGGGGGGASSSGATNTSPASAAASFANALKSNDNTAAANMFFDQTKARCLAAWNSLTVEQRKFLGEAIEITISNQGLPAKQGMVQLEIPFIDQNNNLIKAPVIFIYDNGVYKIYGF